MTVEIVGQHHKYMRLNIDHKISYWVCAAFRLYTSTIIPRGSGQVLLIELISTS